jgi:hypothetical protein
MSNSPAPSSAVPKFSLPADLDALHSEALDYAFAVQNTLAASGGCKGLASEALNVLGFNAILLHRGVRSLCEEGWTPVTSLLCRSLLDVFASCVAVCTKPADADYMGFKYLSHFFMGLIAEPGISPAEIANFTAVIKHYEAALSPPDQQRAQKMLAGKPELYWFKPEFKSTKAILATATIPIYPMFKMFSGPTHGGLPMKLIMNDDANSEDTAPREHPENTRKAIVASSRLLTEVFRIRDQWDNTGSNEGGYAAFIANLTKLKV